MTIPSGSASSQRWFPTPTGNAETDLAFQTILQQLYGLESQAVTGATNGSALASGSTPVTGSENAVATGLATVTNVVVSIDNSATAFFEVVSARPSTTPGAIDIFVWATGPVASTTQRTVRWAAIGTPTTPAGGVAQT